MNEKNNKLKGYWFAIVLFGFIGQIVWNIENMYFNTYLFNYIGGTTGDIAFMVSASAVTATLTALFMGALSDKLNKRKVFISVGTILWGLSTMSLAFVSRENVGGLLGKGATVAVVTSVAVTVVIVLDCIMTFFGSMSNDGAFNSWVTDITDDTNRSRVEGVLSSLPMVAMLVVVGLSGILIDALGYPTFFIAVGLFVIICGIIGLFIIKESRSGIKTQENYFKSIAYGFSIKVVKENKNLYLFFIAASLFNIGLNIFMPFLIIYLEKFVGFDATSYSIVLAIGVLVSAVIGVLLSRKMDGKGAIKYIIPSLIVYVVGLIMVYLFRSFAMMIVSVSFALIGYVLTIIVLNSHIRQYTPEDKAGLFQGVRMIFYVLLPMVIGPFIGNQIIESSSKTYINEFKELVNVPVPEIFLASAIFTLLLIIPILIYKKNLKHQPQTPKIK